MQGLLEKPKKLDAFKDEQILHSYCNNVNKSRSYLRNENIVNNNVTCSDAEVL